MFVQGYGSRMKNIVAKFEIENTSVSQTHAAGAITFNTYEDSQLYSYSLSASWFAIESHLENKQLNIYLLNNLCVVITLFQQKLIIQTSAKVDICLKQSMPISDIVIATRGTCEISVNIWISKDIFIAAQQIFLKKQISCSWLSLLTPRLNKGNVQIDAAVTVEQIRCVADTLKVNKRLMAGVRDIECNLLKIGTKGIFSVVKDPDFKQLAFVSSQNQCSKIIANKICNQGTFISINESIDTAEQLILFEDSFTSLKSVTCVINRIIFHKDCHFSTYDTNIVYYIKQHDMEKLIFVGDVYLENTVIECGDVEYSKLCNNITHVNLKLICQALLLNNPKPIRGENVIFEVHSKFDAHGDCIINGMFVRANVFEIDATFDCGEFASLEVEDKAEVTGLIYAKEVVFRGKYLLARLGLNSVSNLLFYKYCYKGGLVATYNLKIYTAVAVRIAGGYFSAPNVLLKTGLNLNLFGVTFAFDYTLLSLLNAECAIDLPIAPYTRYDLLDLDKLARFCARVAYTSTKAEYAGVVSLGILAGSILPLAVAGAKIVGESLHQEPNLLKHLQHAAHTTYDLGRKSVSAVRTGINALAPTADGHRTREEVLQTLHQIYSVDKLLEIVDNILAAKGLFLKGSSIYSHAKNAAVFICDMPSAPDILSENLRPLTTVYNKRYKKGVPTEAPDMNSKASVSKTHKSTASLEYA